MTSKALYTVKKVIVVEFRVSYSKILRLLTAIKKSLIRDRKLPYLSWRCFKRVVRLKPLKEEMINYYSNIYCIINMSLITKYNGQLNKERNQLLGTRRTHLPRMLLCSEHSSSRWQCGCEFLAFLILLPANSFFTGLGLCVLVICMLGVAHTWTRWFRRKLGQM